MMKLNLMNDHTADQSTEPEDNCQLCPRLADFRASNTIKFPEFFNAPVPSWGSQNAELLIVGLAPGLKGANQTGRPFTGDAAGDLLYETLDAFDFSSGKYGLTAQDGLELKNCMITNAVRCVPPENKPVGAEINQCRSFLINQINALKRLKIILCLGKISHDSTLRALGLRVSTHKFGHNQMYDIGGYKLIGSYHCSRYNTNTGKLTTEMFHDVFRTIKSEINS